MILEQKAVGKKNRDTISCCIRKLYYYYRSYTYMSYLHAQQGPVIFDDFANVRLIKPEEFEREAELIARVRRASVLEE